MAKQNNQVEIIEAEVKEVPEPEEVKVPEVKDDLTVFGKIDVAIRDRRKKRAEKKQPEETKEENAETPEPTEKVSRFAKVKSVAKTVGIGVGITAAVVGAAFVKNAIELEVTSDDAEGTSDGETTTEVQENSETLNEPENPVAGDDQ